MIQFALLGTGRIGRMHAEILAAHEGACLGYVYDPFVQGAQEVAAKYNAQTADIETILANPDIDAVLIASSTDTHIDLITRSVKAGKAVLCEKPIDLDIRRVNQCKELMDSTDVPVQIGFNRRFDPGHQKLAEAVTAGETGQLEGLIITSRDPAPPPTEYIKVSGGLFRDMMIHDFDMARYILGEEPIRIYATGSVQVDPEIAALGDIDSAMVTLTTSSGTLCHIHCSRRAVYGYDQRIEAFGSEGMFISDNPRVDNLVRTDARYSSASSPLHYFFIERYQQAYQRQLDSFMCCLESGEKPSPSFDDGRKALLLADAGQLSLETGQAIDLSL